MKTVFVFCPMLALFTLVSSASAANGTWTNNPNGTASGSWTNAANWSGGIIADNTGSTADFSTLDITNGSIIGVDSARTIGSLVFGDVTPSTNWIVNASSTNNTLPAAFALTLSAGTGSPVINVSNQTATFNASVFGTSGFIKAGGGTLRLNGANTNAIGSLSGLIVVTNGILQAGNNAAFGVNGPVINGSSTNAVICTNGGTLEIISTIQPNNELLVLGGTGNGGTNGALYANLPASAGSTRWGLSSVNASGVSGNSSVSAPAIILATNTTIRIDGAAIGAYSNLFNCGYITSSTNTTANTTNALFTLTKTGTGRLNFERGAMVSNIVIQAGSIAPDSANGFNAVNLWTVNAGAFLYVNQNQVFNSANISLQVNAGALVDMNWRGTGVVGSDTTTYTHSLGTLNGAGTITSGTMGNIGVQTLNLSGTANNSSFSGTITTANGTLNLGKTGAGTILRLSGNNSYNGTTTVSAGTLLVNGSHTGGAGYSVTSAGTLGGTGSISPSITLNGGQLVAGDGGGTLTVNTVLSGGGDTTILSNANLTVSGLLGSSGAPLGTLYVKNGTLQLPLLGGGASAFISTLNNDGNFTLSYTAPNPTVGQFPLIAYSTIGGLAGGGLNGITLVPPSGTVAYLSNNVANGTLDVVVTGIPALVWRGTPTGDWSIGGSANWLNGATPSAYTESGGVGSFVIFDDTAVGTTAVNLTTTVSPKGMTVNITSKNYTNTGTGAIGGTGGLLKQGSGVLTIANSGSNYFSGTLAVLAGEVRVGNGGTAGNLGNGPVDNESLLTFNRSDNVTVPNVITGAGTLAKSSAGIAILTGIGNYGGAVSLSGGTLTFAPGGTIILSNSITGAGALGVSGGGKVVLESSANTWSGGTVIANSTLQIGDAASAGSLSGNVTDNGTLSLYSSNTFTNNISGTGGVLLPNSAAATFTGVNTYGGPTVVLGGSITADAFSYSANSVLSLGNQTDDSSGGMANFTAGNPVLAGLTVAGAISPSVNLITGGQTLTINGNVSVGCVGPAGGSALLQPTGTGASIVVNTNGGILQFGLGATGSGVNPDSVFVDFSGIDNFTANLGTNGAINLGTLDGNPGPPAGAAVVNWFNLAAVSNSITAGAINIGAGGRQLIPELRLGTGTNVLNVNALTTGFGGRDGGYLHFLGGTGGVRVRANDGVSRAAMAVGNNPTTTGASIADTVDLTGHAADLLLSTLIIGNYNNVGAYNCTFSFDTGVLDAQSTSLSLIRNTSNPANTALSLSTLNIGGGTAALGPVSLTASAAAGTLNINNANVTVANITSPGTGTATLSIGSSTLNLSLTNNGNPVTAPVAVDAFSASGTVNLAVGGNQITVGQFPLISYTGTIGGDGYAALNLTSLPSGVGGYLSNDVANLSVDLVITNAPVYVNTNPTNLTAIVNSGNLELSWPADHTGWHLQAQTNSLANGLGTNWVTIPNTQLGNSYTNAINALNGSVFYRMVYP